MGRDIGKTALKPDRLPGDGPRSFRENQDILPFGQGFFALHHHAHRIAVIADISSGAHHPAKIGVVPQLMLDDALHIGHTRHQKHRVQQRGMIGNDERAAQLRQLFRAMETGIDNTTDPQHENEETESMIDHAAHPADARLVIFREQRDRWKDEQRHECTAQTETGKGNTGSDQSPGIIYFLKHDGGTTSLPVPPTSAIPPALAA